MAESVLKEARSLAQRMLVSGETTCPIQSLGGAEVGCVSSDETKLLWLVKFTEGGKVFFIGHRRREP